jgi:2-polyprenyl-3-methyl-5-hydroxy-6-metoxy-1,4-benzoquinol methylase
MREPLLESFLRTQRLNRVLPHIKSYQNCELLDIGCGWDARLLKEVEPYIHHGFGIDYKAPNILTEKIQTISATLEDSLPFEDASFDLITLLAVLEHLDRPLPILRECARLLRPGGAILLTVPSRSAKPVLEFLAFRLGIVNADEIRDHKRYFNRADLFELLGKVDSLSIKSHQYFQFGFNNQVVAVKKITSA